MKEGRRDQEDIMIKNKRSIINYSIKRRMQLRLLLNVMVIALIATGLTSAFFYYHSSQEVGHSFKEFHVQAKTFLDFLFPTIIMALAIGIVLAFGMALFFPHRIAGPLYRIERDLKERVGEGDLSIKFGVRKGDEVGELADALNVMVEKLKLKIGKIKTAADDLSSQARNLNKGDESLRKIIEIAKRLEEAVREFKL